MKEIQLKNGQVGRMRALTEEEIPAVLQVQEITVQNMKDPSMLATLTEEEYRYLIQPQQGALVGVWVGQQLIAFRAALCPPIYEEHLGYDLGLTTAELAGVLYEEITCVLPAYQGNRLQQRMAAFLLEQVDLTTYTHLCATTSPVNEASMRDKFVQGLLIVDLKEKYGGRWRYIFGKPLHVEPPHYTQCCKIERSNFLAQQEAFAVGWSGIGADKNFLYCVK